MENKYAVDQLPEGLTSKFQYVMLVARRAEQIIQGSMPKEKTKHSKPSRIAMHEVDNDLVQWSLAEMSEEELQAAGFEDAASLEE